MENPREQTYIDRTFRDVFVPAARVDGMGRTAPRRRTRIAADLAGLEKKPLSPNPDPDPGEPEFVPWNATRH
jgi:hypothetical protein